MLHGVNFINHQVMARPRKTGLDYFPLDVDFFQDLKIRKLIRSQGGKAVTVYALLLCFIYKNGYYIRWDEELPFIISEQTGYDETYIREVIKCCVGLGLFSSELYEKDGVLTSRGIQDRYLLICSLAKRKGEINVFSLISSETTDVSSEEIPVISETISVSYENSTQRKEKKNKENQIHAQARDERMIFFEIFFWRNFQNPAYEAERYLQWLESEARHLKTVEQKMEQAKRWKPETSAPRVPDAFLKMWKELHDYALHTDTDVANKMLAPDITAYIQGGNIALYCHLTIWEWIRSGYDQKRIFSKWSRNVPIRHINI